MGLVSPFSITVASIVLRSLSIFNSVILPYLLNLRLICHRTPTLTNLRRTHANIPSEPPLRVRRTPRLAILQAMVQLPHSSQRIRWRFLRLAQCRSTHKLPPRLLQLWGANEKSLCLPPVV